MSALDRSESGERPLPGPRPHTVGGARVSLGGISFVRALITVMRALPSWSSHLPKCPPPNTVTWGLGFFLHMNLGETQTFHL